MEIKTTIQTALFLAGSLLAVNVNASTIGTYTFDDSAIANQLVSANGYLTDNGADLYYASGTIWDLYNGSGWDSASAPTGATDSLESSYLAAIPGYSAASLDLGFGNTTAFNGVGSDIVFFFLWDQSNNTTTVNINGHSQELNASNLYDASSSLYLADNVLWDNTTRSNVLMMAAEIELSDFGLLAGAILDEPINISMHSTSTSPVALSMVAALNADPVLTAVPLPAPLLLLLSGLASLGVFSRRKN